MTNKISFEVDKDINITGTSKRGSIKTTFNHIVIVFGEQTNRMGDNSLKEWRMQFRVPDDEGLVFDYITVTIYDWSEETDPARKPNDAHLFNIGSKSIEGPYLVHQFVGESP